MAARVDIATVAGDYVALRSLKSMMSSVTDRRRCCCWRDAQNHLVTSTF